MQLQYVITNIHNNIFVSRKTILIYNKRKRIFEIREEKIIMERKSDMKKVAMLFVIGAVVLFAGCSKKIPDMEGNHNQDATEISVESETEQHNGNESVETASSGEDNSPIYAEILCPYYTSYINYRAKNTVEKPLSISILSEKKNGVIDCLEWYSNNELFLPIVAGSEFAFMNIEQFFDVNEMEYLCSLSARRTLVFYDETYTYSVNTSRNKKELLLDIYEFTTGKLLWELDFSDLAYQSQKMKENKIVAERAINWATISGNTLYVAIGGSGYAEENASYMIAVDLDTLQILWKSETLTCNSDNFIIYDDIILCGYGFTNEKDYLYQLDSYTGEILDRTPIKTKADYFVIKDDQLYVRCYNVDYVFEVE